MLSPGGGDVTEKLHALAGEDAGQGVQLSKADGARGSSLRARRDAGVDEFAGGFVSNAPPVVRFTSFIGYLAIAAHRPRNRHQVFYGRESVGRLGS